LLDHQNNYEIIMNIMTLKLLEMSKFFALFVMLE